MGSPGNRFVLSIDAPAGYPAPGSRGRIMKHQHDRLRDFTAAIFHAAGCRPGEAQCIAAHLVEANLVGHDSHGVIRVPSYVQWLEDGKVYADRTLHVAFENDVIAVVD